jgi:hypothetical protein
MAPIVQKPASLQPCEKLVRVTRAEKAKVIMRLKGLDIKQIQYG